MNPFHPTCVQLWRLMNKARLVVARSLLWRWRVGRSDPTMAREDRWEAYKERAEHDEHERHDHEVES